MGRVARVEDGDLVADELGDVARLLKLAGAVGGADSVRAVPIRVDAVVLAGFGAAPARRPSTWSAGRGGGPGQAAVEGAAGVEVVVVVADAVGLPVGRPGVHHHDKVAVDETAVPLGRRRRGSPRTGRRGCPSVVIATRSLWGSVVTPPSQGKAAAQSADAAVVTRGDGSGGDVDCRCSDTRPAGSAGCWPSDAQPIR